MPLVLKMRTTLISGGAGGGMNNIQLAIDKWIFVAGLGLHGSRCGKAE